jgi:hypothetical protein
VATWPKWCVNGFSFSWPYDDDMHDRNRDTQPELSGMTGVGKYNRSHELRPESRSTTGAVSYDRSRDVEPES